LYINPDKFLLSWCSISESVIVIGIATNEVLFLKTIGESFEGSGLSASIFFVVLQETSN
jgi:hypothetical protein